MKMDKLLNSPWFVKVVALFLALMLYAAVNMDTQTSQPSPSILPKISTETEALADVPLTAYYDEEIYSVANLPKEVTVYIEGPSSAITTTKMHGDYEVYVDMRNLPPGKHNVQVKSRDFSNNLDVRVEPSSIIVDIQEKIAQVMPVKIDYQNEEKVAEGYTVENPIVVPKSVTVTGAKEQVRRISMVNAAVDLSGANEDIQQNVPLRVYDQNGNILDLKIEPSVVEVRVPINPPSKVVPLKVNQIGNLPEGFSIRSIEKNPSEVIVFGPKELIEEITFVDDVTLDLSTITEDTKVEVKVPLPEGMKKVEPETISISIDIEPEEIKELTNVPIKIDGISETQDVRMISPEDGFVNLNVYGAASVLETVRDTDFDVRIDVAEYSPGEHDVPIEVVTGPPHVRWETNPEQVKVEIITK